MKARRLRVTRLIRTDLIGKLPTEIAAAILSYLDDNALTRCLKVSHRWREVASSPAVWRSSFLGRYARAEENVLPYIQFGGQGLGQRANQPQEWQRMCAARRKIEKNWKTEYPKAVYFVGHTDSVYCCQFDEDKIITGSRDRTIRVWDLNHPYKCRKVIGGPAARPQRPTSDVTLETHPTNTFHQTRSLNGTPEGDAIYHVPSDYHTASILCLQFDEEIMVTGSSDHSCIVWDIHTYEPIRRLLHHSAGVLDVCMDDKYIISCSKDAHICVWDRKTFTLIKALHGHRGPVNAVQLREIGGKKLLVSASGDGLAKIWDLAKLDVVKQFNSQDRGLAAVEFSDDGKFVLAGGNDQVIYKFDVHTTELVHTFRGHSSLVRSLFLDSANSRVVSGSYDQGIRVYDFHSGELVGSYDNWTTSWILAAKGDYRRIVATSQDGRALLMDFGHAVQDVGLLGARATLPAVPAVPVAPWEARRALPPSSVVAVTDEMVGFEHLGSVV
jgi:F-box and WD-40 domain protein 1/11